MYQYQGRYAEAEAILHQVAEAQAQTLGLQHPHYFTTLNNLARVYRAQSRYAEAEALFQKVAQIEAHTLGRQHPNYLATLHHLARLYAKIARYEQGTLCGQLSCTPLFSTYDRR